MNLCIPDDAEVFDPVQVVVGLQLLSADEAALLDGNFSHQCARPGCCHTNSFLQVLAARFAFNLPDLALVEDFVAPLWLDGEGEPRLRMRRCSGCVGESQSLDVLACVRCQQAKLPLELVRAEQSVLDLPQPLLVHLRFVEECVGEAGSHLLLVGKDLRLGFKTRVWD